MGPTVKRLYQLLILGGIGILLFILAFSTPVFFNSSDFSIFNPGWNGCSQIAIKTYESGRLQPTFYFEENELTLVQRSFVYYPVNPENSTIVIIGPRASFSTSEGEYIKDFLTNGGMLLLADDFGTANDLLDKIDSTSRFSGDLMLDLSFEKNASFVTVFDFLNHSHPLVSNVSHILLNYPSSITAGDNGTVLAVSTEMSWLDINLNGKQDFDEPIGPFPVLVLESYGKGEIVLFSGPSLLINSMENQLGNSVFRDNLFNYLYNDRDTVIIDESHRDASALLNLAYVFPSAIGFEVKIAIVLLVICAFIVLFTDIPRYILRRFGRIFVRSREMPVEASYDKIVDEVVKEHPSWSRKKLEQILQGLK